MKGGCPLMEAKRLSLGASRRGDSTSVVTRGLNKCSNPFVCGFSVEIKTERPQKSPHTEAHLD